MTVEQRRTRLHDLNEQAIAIRNEIRELKKDERHQKQQDCLQWVGRAFSDRNADYLITSVPPIQQTMQCDVFNEYQFPCIKLPHEKTKPPIFDETLFITEVAIQEMNEMQFADFQALLHERIDYLLLRASTAKVRQYGKEVWYLVSGEICEK